MMQLKTEDVRLMAAGGTMDDLIQEFVFGFQGSCEDGTWYVVPSEPFSNDVDCARQVVAELPTRGDETFTVSRQGNEWIATFDCRNPNKKHRRRTVGQHIGIGDTMPLAVCRAALLAFSTPQGADIELINSDAL